MFRSAHVVKRRTGGAWVDGKWIAGPETELSLELGIQPAAPDAVKNLPEGIRTLPTYTVFSDAELLPTTSAGRGDLIVSAFGELEVYSVESWQSGVISHYKSIAQRKE